MVTLREFLDSPWSLVVYHGDEDVFRSREKDLHGLVKYLDETDVGSEPIVFFDRYVGRAAAGLMLLRSPARVATGVVSEAGRAMLEEHQVPLLADRTVQYLMNVASDGMCRWEKFSLDKTPNELLAALRREYDG